MDGTLPILLAAVAAGSFLGPAGESVAARPDVARTIILLLLVTLAMSAVAAWRAAFGPMRYVPPGPALPKLRRRMSGPRDRRA